MGCDIHVYVEYNRGNEDEQKEWVNCDDWRYNPYYKPKPAKDIDDATFLEELDYDERMYEHHAIYTHRNYTLFSYLADVRNDGSIKPIVEPRGIPEDVHILTLKEYERWDSDAHTPSYLTLKELKEYAKANRIKQYKGYLSEEQIKKLDAGEKPTDWWGEDAPIGLMEERKFQLREWMGELKTFDTLIEALDKRMRDVHWLGEWKTEEECAEYEEDIRIVFWFDN